MDRFTLSETKRKLKHAPVQPADRKEEDKCLKASVCCYLQSRCTRDDFNQLLRDDSLAGAIERQSQFVNHLGYKEKKGIRQRNLIL